MSMARFSRADVREICTRLDPILPTFCVEEDLQLFPTEFHVYLLYERSFIGM